jgi:hypothetical protein
VADRTIVLATNKRHAVRGLTVVNPQEFSAYQEDNDELTYVVDMSSYLDGATISSVTRTPSGVTVSNTSNTTSRLTQRLKGFGYVDFKVTTSSGDVEEFRIGIVPRAGSSFFLETIASVPQNTAQLYNVVQDVNASNIDSGIAWVRTQGYYAVGDGGGALYKRVYTTPSHGAYITSNSATAYWELAEFPYNVRAAGAKGDGVTNDRAAIQAVIDLAASGGGEEIHVPAGTYAIASSLTLKNGAMLRGVGEESEILWAGSTGAVITSASAAVLVSAGLVNLKIDAVAATKIIELYGPYKCTLSELHLKGTSATAVAIDIRADSSAGTNPAGNRNAAFNTVANILHDGTCGTFVRLIGLAGTPQVVTLNTLHDLSATDVKVVGIDLAEWCDNNFFSGVCRVSLTANNAIGVYHTSAHASNNLGVYANNFDLLAVDTFGSLTGRVGIKMNYTKFNVVSFYFNEPIAEGGSLVTTSNSLSYDIGQIVASSNFYERIVRGRATYEHDSNHLRLLSVDGTKDWGINVDSATGNLRVTRVSGSGVATLSNLQVVASVGFNNTSPVAKQTVTGSRGGNAALQSLLTALANYGLITDSSS